MLTRECINECTAQAYRQCQENVGTKRNENNGICEPVGRITLLLNKYYVKT